jgi:hypothetical protein
MTPSSALTAEEAAEKYWMEDLDMAAPKYCANGVYEHYLDGVRFGIRWKEEQGRDERMFPIIPDRSKMPKTRPHPTSIPWWLADLAYSVYSRKNGTWQSLETIASRGGFGATEMDQLVPDWRERLAPPPPDEREKLVEALKKLRDPRQWKTGGAGGCDMYQGLPPAMRIVDELLRTFETGTGGKV